MSEDPDCGAVEMFTESDHVSVYRCELGCLHFTIGPLALRLTPSEFAEIAAVVLYATERVQLGAHQPRFDPSRS